MQKCRQTLNRSPWIRIAAQSLFVITALTGILRAQTDCAEGGHPLETNPPKDMGVQELIQKFTAAETKVRDSRSHYTYTQDVRVQTLNDKVPDGQWHQVTQVSYDAKGNRVENVSFSEQSTLRDVQMSAEDFDDIRVFMQWILATDQVSQYKLTYSGQQHVDDLDTYVFQVEPVIQEKNKRYFEGRIWVDNRDLQIVKLCGKSAPEIRVKKHQPAEVRPTFVGYRQLVDGNWFPAYARIDDTLHFGVESIHIREILKFIGYKRVGSSNTAAKP